MFLAVIGIGAVGAAAASTWPRLHVRSALAYAASFKCPARLYYSHQAWEHMHRTSQRTAEVAKERGLDVEATLVEGNHFSMVQPAMKQSIEFFQATAPGK